MQAQAWAPFDSPVYRLNIQGDEGFVLAWDGARADADLSAAGVDPGRCRLVPETAFYAPHQDGARLLQCAEGFDGQIWREGLLCASRWWSQIPDAVEWDLFLHDGGSAGAALPAPEHHPMLSSPWVRLQGSRDGEGAADLESRAVLALGLALALCFGFVARQAWDVQRQIRERDAAITKLQAQVQTTLRARDEALNKVTLAQQWSALLSAPLPIEVVMHLNDTLGKSGALVKDLELTGSKLRIYLQLGPQSQRSAVVRDLQSGGWFKNVSEARVEDGRGLMVLDMTIEGLRPPAAAIAAPGGQP